MTNITLKYNLLDASCNKSEILNLLFNLITKKDVEELEQNAQKLNEWQIQNW